MERDYTIRLGLNSGYAFTVDFDDPAVPPLVVDEPMPLGNGDGPNAVKLLGAAVAECLASSFLFCVRKARVEVADLGVRARVAVRRNEHGRLRIAHIDVWLDPDFAPADAQRMSRCVELFQDYCTVTATIADAIPVSVWVTGLAPAGGPVREERLVATHNGNGAMSHAAHNGNGAMSAQEAATLAGTG